MKARSSLRARAGAGYYAWRNRFGGDGRTLVERRRRALAVRREIEAEIARRRGDDGTVDCGPDGPREH